MKLYIPTTKEGSPAIYGFTSIGRALAAQERNTYYTSLQVTQAFRSPNGWACRYWRGYEIKRIQVQYLDDMEN